jgi:hypothetical protein
MLITLAGNPAINWTSVFNNPVQIKVFDSMGSDTIYINSV